MNRSMFYNLPFSGILFNNMFLEMHGQILSMDSNYSSQQTVRVFAESFVKEWFNYRGQGHYSIIKRIFGYLFISDSRSYLFISGSRSSSQQSLISSLIYSFSLITELKKFSWRLGLEIFYTALFALSI